jgi:hypothetical protein
LHDAIVEPFQTTGHLPSSVIVVHTFVTVRYRNFFFRVANIGHDDIWITPRTRVGILLKGDIETSDNCKIEFMRTEFTEEIYVNEDVHCSEFPNDFVCYQLFNMILHFFILSRRYSSVRLNNRIIVHSAYSMINSVSISHIIIFLENRSV